VIQSVQHPKRIFVAAALSVVLAGGILATRSLLAADSTQEFDVLEATIREVHEAFESDRLTCRTLVEGYLERISAYDQVGPRLNTVQYLNPRALQQADSLDALYRRDGPVGSLHCVPILLKDQVETRDMPTSFGSVLFEEWIPRQDATVVRRLRHEGALILAKSTMGEFASRYVGSAHGIIRNAYDPTRNPSGSSGGTAAGIAANFGLVGIGEDTAGSVRGPAAVHSLVGLRPTLPLVPRTGMMPANPSQDTMGPITRSVADAALVLDVLAGYDPEDPITARSVGLTPETYAAGLSTDGLRGSRIGVIRDPQWQEEPGAEDYARVRTVFNRAVLDLERLGAMVVDPVDIPAFTEVVAASMDNPYETEAATDAYLAARPSAPYATLSDILLTGRVNPWRAQGMVGVLNRSTDDPGYLDVLDARKRLRTAVLKVMADHDLDALVYPTFSHEPSLIAPDVETNPEPADEYGKGDRRSLSPATGFPALTVPGGFTSLGLPVGVEFLARPFEEPLLFRLGYAYEQGTRHRRPPETTPALQSR
jgi:Asp-tRNA(Asn)/Glu-tRNA(Gln) amidotransferase A subunit family amidase